MLHLDTKVVKSTLRGIASQFEWIIQQGGTYSGKTFCVILALVLLMQSSEKRLKIRVIGQTRDHLKDGALSDFLDITDQLVCIKRVKDTKFWIGNSTIKFLSIDKIGKAKGPKFDITFINEANHLPYKIINQLKIRTDISMIIDFNPSAEFWLHTKILPLIKKGIKILYKRTTYKDNPSVSERKIKEIEAYKDIDPEFYRVYALGLTGRIEGLVYRNWNMVTEVPELKRVAYGLDFGFTNDPTALVKCGLNDGKLYVQELIYQTGMTNQDIAAEFKRLGIRHYDEIIADSSEPKSIEEIRRMGYNIKGVTKGKDSVNLGIDILKRYPICVTSDSFNVIRELNNYKYKENSKDGEVTNNPIDKFNHAMDALRYYAREKLFTNQGRQIAGAPADLYL